MTPADLAEMLEKVPPGFLGIKIVDLLRWQAAHGKRLLNIGYYGETAYRDFYKRERTNATAREAMKRVSKLTTSIGG